MIRETNQEIDGRKVYTVFGLIAGYDKVVRSVQAAAEEMRKG